MPYSTLAQLRIAAGGSAVNAAPLAEISNNEDATTIAQAQALADSYIDAFAYRLYSELLPFGSVAPVLAVPPAIASWAADEAVYVLRGWKHVLGNDDQTKKTQRDASMVALEAGRFNPVAGDVYPIGTASTLPEVVERTSDLDFDFGRDGTKGFW